MNDKIPDSCHDNAFTCFEYELAHVWESFPTTSEGFENSSCCMIEYWPKMMMIMMMVTMTMTVMVTMTSSGVVELKTVVVVC